MILIARRIVEIANHNSRYVRNIDDIDSNMSSQRSRMSVHVVPMSQVSSHISSYKKHNAHMFSFDRNHARIIRENRNIISVCY